MAFNRNRNFGFPLTFAKMLVFGQRCLGASLVSVLTGWKKALEGVPCGEQSHTGCELDGDVTQSQMMMCCLPSWSCTPFLLRGRLVTKLSPSPCHAGPGQCISI